MLIPTGRAVVVMCAHCGRVGMMPQPNSGVADLTCQCGNPVNIATPGVLLAFLQTGQGTVLRSSDGLSNAAAAAAAAAAIGAARAQQARANRGAPSELVKLLPTLLFKSTADSSSSSGSSDKAQSWRCEAAEDLARCDCSDAAKSLTVFQDAPLCSGRAAVALVLDAETAADTTTTDAATDSTTTAGGVNCWGASCTTDTAAVIQEEQQQQHADEDKVSCRVCLCDYEHGEEMRVLPCLHRVSFLLYTIIIIRSNEALAVAYGVTYVTLRNITRVAVAC
jgi:hypothetical protein